ELKVVAVWISKCCYPSTLSSRGGSRHFIGLFYNGNTCNFLNSFKLFLYFFGFEVKNDSLRLFCFTFYFGVLSKTEKSITYGPSIPRLFMHIRSFVKNFFVKFPKNFWLVSTNHDVTKIKHALSIRQ